jgi:alpha-amylase/alpha-mannosidase (GH57 family)
MARVNVAFVWHMHQPWYLWPDSHWAALPFARLHATAAYYDMPWVLRQFDQTRVTFNLVPSLIEQVQGYMRGEIGDRAALLSRRHPYDLSLDDQRYLLTHMCGGHPGGVMAASARYGELSHKRGPDRKPETIDRACSLFTDDEYLDLQVLFNLAWCGFALDNTSEVVHELRRKDRDFTADEKEALLDEMDRTVGLVIGEYARAAADGRAELICSPRYHPILPLLAEMADAERRIPGSQLPERRWHEPEEARRQIREGLAMHEEVFGARPRGMWPSEGSISDSALRIAAEEGVLWAASDEEVLAASLGTTDRPAPGDLYRPWRTVDGLSLIFRDHRLSDLVGFVYRDWSASDAARDFVSRIKLAAERVHRGSGDPPPLVSIILDGENPWGWYTDAGEGFLREVYASIERDADLQTVTVSEHLEEYPQRGELASVFPGSWIDHSFSTWIGGKEHRRAWELLTDALETTNRHASARPEDAEAVEHARRHLMVAEGSDWFWWYSENQHSLDADVFDELFRSQIAHVYEVLGEAPPDAVQEPIYTEKISRLTREAAGPMTANIDGRITSYFEWGPAALLRTSGLASAMQRSEFVLTEMYFGFDEQNLWLRLDMERPAYESLRDCRLEIVFGDTDAHTIVVEGARGDAAQINGTLCSEADCAVDRIVEVRVPLAPLEVEPGETLRLAIVFGCEGRVIERWPELGYLQVRVPSREDMIADWVI